MKKTLLALLALMLCVSMLVGCGTVIDDDAPELSGNQTEGESLPTQGEEETPKVDKKAVVDAFNKLDLSSFAGISIDSTDMLTNLIMQAEFNMSGTVDGEEGAVAIDVQVKDNVYHITSENFYEDGSKDVTEIFQVIEAATTTIYQKYTDGTDPNMSYDWDKIVADNSEAPSGSMAGMLSSMDSVDPEAIADMIAKVQIPKLDEKHITDANGLALISNDYIVDLIVANLDLVYGAELDEAATKDAKESMSEMLTESGFALYLGVNDAGINKMAVGMEQDGVKLYGEIALTEDCKALDAITLKVTQDFGGPGLEYAPESVLVIKPIYAEVAAEAEAEEATSVIVGADIDVTLYTSKVSSTMEGETGGTMNKTTLYQKIVLDATINLGNIGKVNADIVTLKMDQTYDKAVDYEIKFDEEYNETVISAKENTDEELPKGLSIEGALKSVNPSQIALDASVKYDSTTIDVDAVLNCTTEGDTIIFTGTFVTAGVDIQFEAAISFADFTMPDLPVVEESHSPILPGNPEPGGSGLS